MKKITLNVDDLRVTAFETGEGGGRGTVQANAATPACSGICLPSKYIGENTCQQGSCAEVGTCYGYPAC